MWVKICGISTPEAARVAVEHGADALGFLFAPSKRRVTPEQAAALIRDLPAGVAKVGVFVDETPEAINAIAEQAGLTMVQLHGGESPEFLQQVRVPVLRALRLASVEDTERVHGWHNANGLLLEPFVPGAPGGTGTALDTGLFTAARARMGAGPAPMLVLAGGLNPGNVAAAIAAARPDGVDVSSGVETHGAKDLNKIAAFIAAARRASA